MLPVLRNLTNFGSDNIPGMKVLLVCMLIVGALFFVCKSRSIVIPAQSLLTSHQAFDLVKFISVSITISISVPDLVGML